MCTADDGVESDRLRIRPNDPSEIRVRRNGTGGEPIRVPEGPKDHDVLCLAETGRMFGDLLQDKFEVERRGADRA